MFTSMECWLPSAQASQGASALFWNTPLGLQSRLAGPSPCSVEVMCRWSTGNGMAGTARSKHSPRLSSPIIFVGKFYLFNLLHIMHCLINYCFSAGRTGVYRAVQQQRRLCPPGRLRAVDNNDSAFGCSVGISEALY